jgi:hypothetical protein
LKPSLIRRFLIKRGYPKKVGEKRYLCFCPSHGFYEASPREIGRPILKCPNCNFYTLTPEVEKYQFLLFYFFTLPSVALFKTISYVSYPFFELRSKIRKKKE